MVVDTNCLSSNQLGCSKEIGESSSAVSHKAHFSEESTSSTKSEMKLLDLYAECGAMSTGLCLGAAIAGVNLVTRWAVDMNEHACKSLAFNHPETKVRNESADDFLALLKKWHELCMQYGLVGGQTSAIESAETDQVKDAEVADEQNSATKSVETDLVKDVEVLDEQTSKNKGVAKVEDEGDEVFEVAKLIDICFGDPNETDIKGVYFKGQWKGYDSSHDSWEPIDNLGGDAEERIREFVTEGHTSKILPLPILLLWSSISILLVQGGEEKP